jgi:hypothetical protein
MFTGSLMAPGTVLEVVVKEKLPRFLLPGFESGLFNPYLVCSIKQATAELGIIINNNNDNYKRQLERLERTVENRKTTFRIH